jgi:mRNA interferase MazF
VLNKVTVAPIISTILGIPSEVNLSIDDGMIKDCIVYLDNIQTVHKSQIGGYITTLNSAKLKQVSYAIRFALNL